LIQRPKQHEWTVRYSSTVVICHRYFTVTFRHSMNIAWCTIFISDFLAVIFLMVILQTYFSETFAVQFFKVISIYNINNNFLVVPSTSWTVCAIVFSLLFLIVFFLSVGHDHLRAYPTIHGLLFPVIILIFIFISYIQKNILTPNPSYI
jgi:hypothetical protein